MAKLERPDMSEAQLVARLADHPEEIAMRSSLPLEEYGRALVHSLTRRGERIDYAMAEVLSAVISEERRRIAIELHGSLAQSIYGMSLLAETAERYLAEADRDAVASRLSQIRQLSQEMLAEMRILIFRLRPPEMATLGLAGAIRNRLLLVEERAGIKTFFTAEGDHRPPPELEEAILGIANELLNNAMRHARASSIKVRLRQSSDELLLEVVDDGMGFDLDGVREGTGFGLADMDARSRAIAAKLTIETAPGRGTRAVVIASPRAAAAAMQGEHAHGVAHPHPRC